MFKRKGQSVSEYAIVLGLIIAIAAGVSQILLKGALRDKQQRAVSYLNNAGSAILPATSTPVLYNQEIRQTKIKSGDTFLDQTVMKKGGGEEKIQLQEQETASSSIETLNQVATP